MVVAVEGTVVGVAVLVEGVPIGVCVVVVVAVHVREGMALAVEVVRLVGVPVGVLGVGVAQGLLYCSTSV